MNRRRALLVAAVGLAATMLVSSPAHADPAEPTDYRTIVVSVTPPTPAVDVDIIGGDSFVQVTVAPGTEVVIEGYQGEPYLRFGADGVVERNERSPTRFTNTDRYGGQAPPPEASADAPPEWRPVGRNGRYSWHDHRAHWMQRQPKPGAERGDRILERSITLLVDGAQVEVVVASDWLDPPSPMAAIVGAGLAALALLAALLTRRRLAWVLLAAATAAAALGYWQFRSLPEETGPLAVWWALPAVAAGSALVALLLGWRQVAYALAALGALELGVWVWIRRDGMRRAVLPTDAPFWLDRGVTAAAGVTTIVVGAGALVAMFRYRAAD